MRPHDEITVDFDWFYRKPFNTFMFNLSSLTHKFFLWCDARMGRFASYLRTHFGNPYLWTKKSSNVRIRKFSFENVDTLKGGLFKENYYHVFYDFDQIGEKQMFWATGNAGFALSQLDNSGPDQFPSYRADNGFNGKCACLQTLSTGVFGQAMHKPIAAGNLFLGKFIVEYAASESLKATAFGLPWDKEPVRVTGYYKYKPGKEVINYMEEVIPDRTDEASAYAVFYRNLDEKGEKYTLDGEAVSELDKLMDNPQVYKVARVPALPPTDQWRHFEMFFEGKDAPDDMVAKKEFSLAIVFSSSVRGAWFEGAIGSTLYVDEVEVSCEK
jgi:hypothetical protein